MTIHVSGGVSSKLNARFASHVLKIQLECFGMMDGFIAWGKETAAWGSMTGGLRVFFATRCFPWGIVDHFCIRSCLGGQANRTNTSHKASHDSILRIEIDLLIETLQEPLSRICLGNNKNCVGNKLGSLNKTRERKSFLYRRVKIF